MTELSKGMEQYFAQIQEEVDKCYAIAESARRKGIDPEKFVESPQAKDLAGRVEKLVGPEGVAQIIRDLKREGKSDDEIAFQVVSDILDKKIGKINSLDERVERAIRVGLAIKTMGVVSAPLEGISKVLIRTDQQNRKYLSLYFAGPIRAAGGTTEGLCVLIADYVRRKSNIPKYEATQAEIGRYLEEVKMYDRRVHLQYPSSNAEIRFTVEHLPVEINGDSTEDEEVSAFRNLPRIETNKIRGGACLVLNDGIISKSPKLLKIAKAMKLDGWDWLAELKKIGQKEQVNEKKKEQRKKQDKLITPNSKYISDIIAGRPVFSHPSRIGGHRIRYGRSRNTGLAAMGIHPATMAILDDFIAIGTQLRIERPGKSTSVCPVDSIEPPIVKLKNGNVIQVKNRTIAKKIFPKIKEILFLGDVLFGYGEFAENNHKLIPSGYVEEWWVLDLEEKVKKLNLDDTELINFIAHPFAKIPNANHAVELSLKYGIPLHPKYTFFWDKFEIQELEKLRSSLLKSYNNSESKILLNNEDQIKYLLEKALIPHKVKEEKIIFNKDINYTLIYIFNLNTHDKDKPKGIFDPFQYFYHYSSIIMKSKYPYFMGTRMGRPEKSERKSMKGIHTLFPLSDKIGSSRLVEKAIELGKIKIDVCRKFCPKCNSISIFNICPDCGSHTILQKICESCKRNYPKNEEKCPKCGEILKFSSEALFNIKKHINKSLKNLGMSLPNKFKGIIGLTNQFKIPEPIEKGLLRAKNELLVYKTAEIRYDATDIPLTHFKPKEIKTEIDTLRKLGYTKDYKNNELKDEEQICELKVQDILLSDDCAEYFIRVANFIDDELDKVYNMEKFYNVSKRQDLIGHLVVGLAPHTSAGIIGRIIGFSPVRSIYAHPFWHAAKRRNCDGDEDGIMMLLDPLLNFSRYYLPSKIGGRMDATLVISTKLDPNEIDTEAHNIDTLSQYPKEFYEETLNFSDPSKIESLMDLVDNHIKRGKLYEDIGFNIPTSDINEGPITTSYKIYENMDDKIDAQLHLARIIKAVDERNVAEKILSTHFNPDILGNLRKFAIQEFRCVKCNQKYKRPPISNAGNCPKCGGNIILTVNRGGIEKYIPRAISLCKNFNLDDYTVQRMELIEEYVESLTNNPKIKQQKLSDFF